MRSIPTASGEQRVTNTMEPGIAAADYEPDVYEPLEATGEPNFPQEEWALLATGDPAA